MRKITLCFASLFLISALMLTGCGQKADSSPETNVQMIDGEDTISYAIMSVTKGEETRQERAANREDLKTLKDHLLRAEKAEKKDNYDSLLSVVTEDGREFDFQVSFQDRYLLLEGGGSYRLSQEGIDYIEGMFTTLKGWIQYGDLVRVQMSKDEIRMDESELSLTLYNDTGDSIDYITSPIIYQMQEDGSYVQVESIGGFCGFVSHLKEKETLIKIPFKGMFEITEPGSYKVEIQAMAGDELRWGISDTFQIIK